MALVQNKKSNDPSICVLIDIGCVSEIQTWAKEQTRIANSIVKQYIHLAVLHIGHSSSSLVDKNCNVRL